MAYRRRRNKKTTYKSKSKKTYNARKPLVRNRMRRFNPSRVIGFPQNYFCKLKYTETDVLAPAATSYLYSWKINSLNDVDDTGTGHQPSFYDMICSSTGPYQRYSVYGCKVRITIENAGSSPLRYCGIATSSDPTTGPLSTMSAEQASQNAYSTGLKVLSESATRR